MLFSLSEEDKCKHVYLDLRAKSGENLRTLFFGAARQQASLLSTKFDENFGSNFTAGKRLQFAPNNNQHIDHLTDETKNKHNLTTTPRITSDCQRHFEKFQSLRLCLQSST